MQIFSLCILLSSYFIYNSMGAIDEQAPGRRSKRLLQADSRVREEKNDQAEQLRAEKENLRLRQALNHELKRAGPRAQASSARPPSHAGEQDAPRLDGHLSIDLAEGVLLIPLAGSILRLKLAGIESVTRTLDEGCAQLRVRFFEAGGQQEAVSEQRFRGGAAGCFDEVLSCWRSFEASRAKASLPDDSQDLGQLVVLESPPRLPGIALHPKTAAKDACALEAHTNGFRIATQSSSGGFDVLYSWVRHVFFEPPLQPDDEPSGDRLAFLHLHLKAPRALGELKKPTSDVQFRVESDAATALRAFLRGAARLAAPGLNPGLARGLQFEGQTRSQGARTSYCFYGGVLTLLNAWPHGTVVVDMSDVDVVVFEVESCAAALASMVLIMKDRERHPVRVDEIVVAEMGLLQRKLLSLKTTWLRVSGRQDWRRRVREVSRDPDKFAADGGWEALLCAILVAPDIPADAGSDAQEEAEEEGDWAHRDDQPDEDEVEEDGDDEKDEADEQMELPKPKRRKSRPAA
ncbi:unnamed protein product [Prorocentrum cordatum]|uniref:FACT complex subunit n=1 Tax=Prorocentrum cordatum TaxID=2364126 RepID=A0ABN9SDQ4_9DINO|nr:unnamed protein product [Polarella glacialis]